MIKQVEVAIVGTGPAGLTAAIYAARANLNPIIFAGLQHGGQLTTTTEIENWPGFEHGIMGPKLMADMTAQAERVGAQLKYEEIVSVEREKDSLVLKSDSSTYHCKTVIIATGATAKTLGLPREAELMGRGLSTCATCDGFFYKNKNVAVVGGGDSAMEEATYLAKICKKVTIIHRSETFRASQIMLDRARRVENIEFLLYTGVVGLVGGEQGLTAISLENIQTHEKRDLEVDGFFMAIGHHPNSEVFKPWVDTDSQGYVLVKNHTETKTPGVFAAGDIADSVFRQAITASGMGCQAAMQAIRYIESQH